MMGSEKKLERDRARMQRIRREQSERIERMEGGLKEIVSLLPKPSLPITHQIKEVAIAALGVME